MFNATMNQLSLFAQEGGTTVTDAAQQTVETVTGFGNTVWVTFENVFTQIASLAPQACAMVVILVVGFLLAKWIGRMGTALSEAIGLQTAAERSGLASSMKQVGISRTVPSIVGLIVFWLLLSVAVMAAFNVLNLPAVTEAMQVVVAFIPKILVATVVIVIGLLVASFVRGVIATSADRVGVAYAEHLANGCYYVLALITFLAAFNQLGLQFELLNQMILIASGGLALGFALAFGLGGRDTMAGILSGYYVRQRFAAGDHVTIGDLEGTVRDIGPVATTVESDDDGMMHRHSIPNSLMLKEAIR